MESGRAHVALAFCAFAVLTVATALSAPKNDSRHATVTNGRQDNRDLLKFIYTLLYCEGRQCPSWACQDDSAVIHGHCCGCPNALKVNVPPVFCVEDLACPYKMDELCEAYHFMTTCCCHSPWQFDYKPNFAKIV